MAGCAPNGQKLHTLMGNCGYPLEPLVSVLQCLQNRPDRCPWCSRVVITRCGTLGLACVLHTRRGGRPRLTEQYGEGGAGGGGSDDSREGEWRVWLGGRVGRAEEGVAGTPRAVCVFVYKVVPLGSVSWLHSVCVLRVSARLLTHSPCGPQPPPKPPPPMLTPFADGHLTPTATAPGFIAGTSHTRALGSLSASPGPPSVHTPHPPTHPAPLMPVAVAVAVVRPLEEPDLVRRCTGLCLRYIAGLYRENLLDPLKAAVFRR